MFCLFLSSQIALILFTVGIMSLSIRYYLLQRRALWLRLRVALLYKYKQRYIKDSLMFWSVQSGRNINFPLVSWPSRHKLLTGLTVVAIDSLMWSAPQIWWESTLFAPQQLCQFHWGAYIANYCFRPWSWVRPLTFFCFSSSCLCLYL